jgi:hypothetical protein
MCSTQFPSVVNTYPLSFDSIAGSFARPKMLSAVKSAKSSLFLKTPGVWGVRKIHAVESATYSLFPVPLLIKQLLPAPPRQTVSTLRAHTHPENAAQLSTFRMNTCKSVSKQRTLSTFKMNTYAK